MQESQRSFFIPKSKIQGGSAHAKFQPHHPAGAAFRERKEATGRKKLLEERERIDTKLTYHKHRLKALEHEEAQLARKARNHRIFTRGGMLKAFLLKPTLLTDDQVHSLLKIIFHKPEINAILNRMIAEAEEKNEEDENDEKTL